MYSVASCAVKTRGSEEDSGDMARPDTHAAWNFLLACAATPFSRDHRQRARDLARNQHDFRTVLSLAEAHGLIPVVHERVGEIADAVSDEARLAASTAFAQNARQTLWLTQLLLKVSNLFQQRRIEALPYKGPVLAQLLYGNVTLRQYSDLDILVRAADVPRARDILQQAGFVPAFQLSTREEQAYLATGYEYIFHDVSNPNVLELQWRILPRFWTVDFDSTGFFARSQNIAIGERIIPTLGHENLLLVLCAHAAKHAWSKLSWVRDIAELAQSCQLDWDQVVQQSGRLGIQRIVAVTFQLAMKMLSTPVPNAVLPLIDNDGTVARIAEKTRRALEARVEPDVESLAYFQFIARLREGGMDRLRFWWRLAATPGVNEWALVRLPGFLFPLYRGVRIGRLGARLIRYR
jgi:Uncharacterised nucleotidyltransferase